MLSARFMAWRHVDVFAEFDRPIRDKLVRTRTRRRPVLGAVVRACCGWGDAGDGIAWYVGASLRRYVAQRRHCPNPACRALVSRAQQRSDQVSDRIRVRPCPSHGDAARDGSQDESGESSAPDRDIARRVGGRSTLAVSAAFHVVGPQAQAPVPLVADEGALHGSFEVKFWLMRGRFVIGEVGHQI
jgi:hypothetical protein